MNRMFAIVVLAVAAGPVMAADKPPRPMMIEWEWLGDDVQKGFTNRSFRALCTAPIDPQITDEVARGFSGNITRNEHYQMLFILPKMGKWTKVDKNSKNVVRDYLFTTGGRKVPDKPAVPGKTGDDPKTGLGQLKHVKRGDEKADDAIPINGVEAEGQPRLPGVNVTYTMIYTSPPNDAQVKKDGLRLTHLEWLYKVGDLEPRKSPWHTVPRIQWKATSADKCTVEIACEVAESKKNRDDK